MLTRRAVSRWLGAGLMAGAATTGFGQSFPSKPLHIIVPYAPGGSSDLIARTLGQKLQENLGQPVIVDNRPGANGAIGIEAMIRMPADGYTFAVISTGALTVNPHFEQLRYDPLKDLTPISMAAISPLVLAVNAKMTVNSVKDLIAYAKERPGYVTYSIPGPGSLPHLAGELLKREAGLDMLAIPYKGGSPASVAVASGEVMVGIVDTGAVLPLVRSGMVRALAMTDPKRSPSMPDIPTVSEAGVPGFSVNSWIGVLAAAATPPDLVAKLNGEITKALQAPDVRGRFAAAGLDPAPTSADEMGRIMRADFAQWQSLIKAANIKAQ